MADSAAAIRALRNDGDYYLQPPAVGATPGPIAEVPGMPDRSQLLEEFLEYMAERMPAIDREDLLPFLTQQASRLDPNSKPYNPPMRPVWENPVQREAVMQLYMQGGIPALKERFPEDYADDPEDMPMLSDREYLAENLLPPGARRTMETERNLLYLLSLLDESRPLEYSDREVWRKGGGNYLRTGQLNYSDGQVQDIFPWASGGPKYPHAQNSAAAADMFMNPRAPTATAFTGLQNLLGEAISYGAEADGPRYTGENFVRAANRVGRFLSDDSMTSMPTADAYGAGYAEVRQQADASAQAAFDSEPEHSQEFLQSVGAPDWTINPYTGFGAEIAKGIVGDLTPTGTAWDTARDIGTNSALPAAMRMTPLGIARRNFTRDAMQDAAVSAPMEAANEQAAPDGTPLQRAAKTREGEQFMEDRRTVSPYRIRELLQEKSAPMQRMAATNPYLQEDLMNQAREPKKTAVRPLVSISGLGM